MKLSKHVLVCLSVIAIATSLGGCLGSGGSAISGPGSGGAGGGGSGGGGSGYSVGGSVTGLATGSTIVLQNNAGDNITVTGGAATFTFPTSLSNGSPYDVTILTQPATQYCRIINGVGTIASANVTTVQLRCPVATPFAGSGVAGAVDGVGTAASFGSISRIVVDSLGNLFVTDPANHKIRKVTSAGVVSTFAGSGVAGATDGTGVAASFNGPSGLVMDTAGNLYVSDTYNNKIRKITPAGVVSTFAGSGAAGVTNGTGIAASFTWPTHLAIDPAGNLYVAENANNTIRKITPAGVVTTFATNVGGAFSMIGGLATDTAGNIYASAYQNAAAIYKFTPAGFPTIFAGSQTVFGNTNGIGTAASFTNPTALAFEAATGNLYVRDTNPASTRMITSAQVVSNFSDKLDVIAVNPATGTMYGFQLGSAYTQILEIVP